MDIPFDPFSLEILPPIRPDTPKANLFIAGMLLNRISYHFVETALFAKNKFLEIELNFESKIPEKIANLENRLQQLKQYDQRLEDGLGIFFKKLDDLGRRCEQVQKEMKKYFKLLPNHRLPDHSEFNWHEGTGYPLADAGVKVSELCFKLAEKLKDKHFRVGSLVDRFTHGTGSDTEADYCYSHLPVVQEKRRGNPAIVWHDFENDHLDNWNNRISDGDRSFFKRFYFDGNSQTAPYLVSNQTGVCTAPTDWANAVAWMWTALFRQDKPDSGFERLSVSGGEVRLDGELVTKLPTEGQLYNALRYMVGRLQEDPTATFRNDEVKSEIGSDDSSFSISKLILPSKPSALHRILATVIRTTIVRGDDGMSAVTLQKLPELKAFWRSVDPAIERVLHPSQQKN